MVSGEYEVVVHEQVGEVEVITLFKHYEHFKDWGNKEQQSGEDLSGHTVGDGEESSREEQQASQEEIKPQDFGVYSDLVDLWGKEKAYEELNKVIKNYPNRGDLLITHQDRPLQIAFYWGDTPQGGEFWDKVCSQLQTKSGSRKYK